MKKRLSFRLAMMLKILNRRKMWVFCVVGLVFLAIHGLAFGGYALSLQNRGNHVNVSLLLQMQRRNVLRTWKRPTSTRQYTEIFNPNICDNSTDVFLVFVINSAPGNIVRRNRIRRTWASIRNHRGYDIRYAFVLGLTDEKTYGAVFNESKFNEDIIQAATFKDDYLNMTRKTLVAMEWAAKFCSSASFVVKCDDDSLVNPKNLLQYLLQLTVEQSLNLFAGWREREGAHKFDKTSKWHVPSEFWPADLKYPPYLRGYFYVHSMRAIKKLFAASFHIQEVYNVSQDAHIDDVYVGLLAKDVGLNVEWLPHLHLHPPKPDHCDMWGMMATLFNTNEDKRWHSYWTAMGNFDPVKYKCIELRKLLYRTNA